MAIPRFVLAASLLATGSAAQTLTLGDLPCLPTGENGVIAVRIDPPPAAEMRVRLYFRRLNLLVEDFYFTEMVPTGGGNYWGVFPQAEDSEFPRKRLADDDSDEEDSWARWWRAKEGSVDRDPIPDLDREVIEERASIGKSEKRDWMPPLDDPALERFFEGQTTEPAEYFVALVEPGGRRLAETPMQVVPVRDDCRAALSPHQAGLALNLTVGETARWQIGEPVFHWECTGIVTRLDRNGVLRPDETCRACVIAWWPWVTGAAATAGIVAITDSNPLPPQEVSPSRP